jgi:isoleucyl-tRNA synthetase
MISVAKKIKWIPEFGLERELDWLSNMHDWLISKKRYWGLALPIWECKKCNNFEVIGSYSELKQKAIDGWKIFEGKSPHKPWVDEVNIKCSKCGNVIERIPDVGNPWLDAGIVPFSTITKDNIGEPLYTTNRKEWVKWFPADFITESFPGQFKNWFYSMIAMSTVLENQNPYEVVLGFATLLGEDGRPMHKSWGNAIEFNEGAEKIGVDVMRWMFVKQNPADNLLFGYKIAEETRRNFHLTLWNIYNFFVTYANLEGWKPTKTQKISINNVLDGWIVVRLRDTIVNTTKALNAYDARLGGIFIEDFVSDMSLWYIRRSRQRIGLSADDNRDKNDFYIITDFILKNLCRILAPFTPFIADNIFTNLTKTTSVHLAEWPSDKFIKNLDSLIGGKKDAEILITSMNLVRKIAEKGHSQRKEEKIAVKQPLSNITICNKESLDPAFEILIKDELNVKNVIWSKCSGDELSVVLDTKITPELEEEAKTRQLIRDIQNERKILNVNLSDKIDVVSPWIPKDKKLVNLLIKKALINKISLGETFGVKKSSSS